MKTIPITDREKLLHAINECQSCVVALVGEGGIPYAIPMSFAIDNEFVYMHSGKDGHKLDIISQNNKASICFVAPAQRLVYQHQDVACSYSMDSKSVIVTGNIELIDEDNEKIEILNKLMSHYSERKFSYSKPALDSVIAWKLKIESISGRLFGQRPNRKPAQ